MIDSSIRDGDSRICNRELLFVMAQNVSSMNVRKAGVGP